MWWNKKTIVYTTGCAHPSEILYYHKKDRCKTRGVKRHEVIKKCAEMNKFLSTFEGTKEEAIYELTHSF